MNMLYGRLVHGDKAIWFDPPLRTVFSDGKVDGTYVLDCPEFKVFGTGEDRMECESDLGEDFLAMWRGYVEEDIGKLSLDAVKLREALQARMRIEDYKPCGRCGGTGNLNGYELYGPDIHPLAMGNTFCCPDCCKERLAAYPIDYSKFMMPFTVEPVAVPEVAVAVAPRGLWASIVGYLKSLIPIKRST